VDLSTDHELMLAVQNGDLDKLGLLFERYHRHVFNFFLKQTRNRLLSEDLVQDVFYRILKYRHTYRAEGKFTTWMFSIAHNCKIDYMRKRRRRGDESEQTETLVDRDPNPQETLERRDEAAIMHEALSRLSDDKREVLLLSRFQDMKYEDIGQILGCKVGTIKARVHRAMKDLAEHYFELTGTTEP
jgi:RNA polymerase sigma factor (sigma-70 family)